MKSSKPKQDWKKFWFGFDSNNPRHVKAAETFKKWTTYSSNDILIIFFGAIIGWHAVPGIVDLYKYNQTREQQKSEIETTFYERLREAQNKPKVSVDQVMTEFTMNPHRAFEIYSNYYSYFRYADPTLGSFTFEGEVNEIGPDYIEITCHYIDTNTGHRKNMSIQKKTTNRSVSFGDFIKVNGRIIDYLTSNKEFGNTIVIN